MEEKVTQKITIDELAGMIERNIAHKEDINRLENHLVGIVGMIEKLPTRDEVRDLLHLRQRIDEMTRNIREKLHVEI